MGQDCSQVALQTWQVPLTAGLRVTGPSCLDSFPFSGEEGGTEGQGLYGAAGDGTGS